MLNLKHIKIKTKLHSTLRIEGHGNDHGIRQRYKLEKGKGEASSFPKKKRQKYSKTFLEKGEKKKREEKGKNLQ